MQIVNDFWPTERPTVFPGKTGIWFVAAKDVVDEIGDFFNEVVGKPVKRGWRLFTSMFNLWNYW